MNEPKEWIVSVLRNDKQEDCPIKFRSFIEAMNMAKVIHGFTGLPTWAWHQDKPMPVERFKELMAKHQQGELIADSRDESMENILDLGDLDEDEVCEDCGEKGCIGSKIRKLQAKVDEKQNQELATELMDMLRNYSGPSPN